MLPSMILIDSIQAYALAAGGLVLILCPLLCILYRSIFPRTITFFFSKHVVYPYVFQQRRFCRSVTQFDVILQLTYWVGTALCSSIGVHSLTQAGSRAGTLSVIHFIPLLFESHFRFTANLTELFTPAYQLMYGSIGFMAFALALVHVITTFLSNPRLFNHNGFALYRCVVSHFAESVFSSIDSIRAVSLLPFYLFCPFHGSVNHSIKYFENFIKC